jgi:hypothetical protein
VAELLKNSDQEVRKSAALALGQMRIAAASVAPQVAELLKRSDDSQDVVWLSAADALGQMGTAAASVAPQVAQLLKSPNNNVRSTAVYALGLMGTAAASVAPQVAELLKSSDGEVRRSAVNTLRQMGTANASIAPQIAELLKSSDDSLRELAGITLLILADQPSPKLSFLLLEDSHNYLNLRDDLIFWAYMTGGADETNLLHVTWLANREQSVLSGVTKLSHTQTRALLQDFDSNFAPMDNCPKSRKQLAELAELVARAQGDIDLGDRSLVSDLADKFRKAGYHDQAQALDDALHQRNQKNWALCILEVLWAHCAFWALLIFGYPRWPMIQALFSGASGRAEYWVSAMPASPLQPFHSFVAACLNHSGNL